MKKQRKAIDQVATIKKIEPLADGICVVFELTDWQTKRLTAGQLDRLRQAAGLSAGTSSRRLVGQTVVIQQDDDGQLGFFPLLSSGLPENGQLEYSLLAPIDLRAPFSAERASEAIESGSRPNGGG